MTHRGVTFLQVSLVSKKENIMLESMYSNGKEQHSVSDNKPPSCAAKQRFSHLCCQAVVKPGAYSFKIRSDVEFYCMS